MNDNSIGLGEEIKTLCQKCGLYACLSGALVVKCYSSVNRISLQNRVSACKAFPFSPSIILYSVPFISSISFACKYVICLGYIFYYTTLKSAFIT